MHKILQNHLLCAFVANLKIDTFYGLYQESFCDKNLAIRKVFVFCDSGPSLARLEPKLQMLKLMTMAMLEMMICRTIISQTIPLFKQPKKFHRWIEVSFGILFLVVVQCLEQWERTISFLNKSWYFVQTREPLFFKVLTTKMSPI